MSDRKTEFSKLAIKVIGTRLAPNAKEAVRYSYDIPSLHTIVDLWAKIFISLEKSIVQIPVEVSKKYAEIGIEQIKELKTKKITFFHFELAYLKRERDDILIRNKAQQYQTRTVKIGNKEYVALPLFLTLVPHNDTVLLDSRCHIAPTQAFLHQSLLPYLKPGDYGLTNAKRLDEKLRVRITPAVQKEYREILEKKFQSISKLGITVAKPGAAKKSLTQDINAKKASKKVMGALENLFSTIFGEDHVANELEALPIKRIKFQVTFDEKAEQSRLKKLRKDMHDNLPNILDSEYIHESELSFKNADDDQLHRAVLNGVSISKNNDLPLKHHMTAEKMWAEQRRVYFEVTEDGSLAADD